MKPSSLPRADHACEGYLDPVVRAALQFWPFGGDPSAALPEVADGPVGRLGLAAPRQPSGAWAGLGSNPC